MQQQPQLQLDDPHSLHLNNPTSTGESIDPPSTLSPHINHTPITTSTPTTSVLPLYLATGATLLTAGVAFGIRLGNRQAAQIEADNPPPPATSTRTTARPPPPITPQQRAAAFRATLGALGLGTVLCGALGVGLVWGMGRWLDVGDTKAFAVRMDRVVSEQRVRWLGSMVSCAIHILCGECSGLMRECDLQFCRADVLYGQSTTNIPSRLTMPCTHNHAPNKPLHHHSLYLTLPSLMCRVRLHLCSDLIAAFPGCWTANVARQHSVGRLDTR